MEDTEKSDRREDQKKGFPKEFEIKKYRVLNAFVCDENSTVVDFSPKSLNINSGFKYRI